MDSATNEKLTVICNVEAGCLGPSGDQLIEGFCNYAQQEFQAMELEYLDWLVRPRVDNSVPEVAFRFANKTLSRDQAATYLTRHGESIEELESMLDNMLAYLIEEYRS
jgi:hypothetical protein